MTTTAKIMSYNDGELVLMPQSLINRELLQRQVGEVEIRLNDGRAISSVQRRKTFALIRDISDWYCDTIDYMRSLLMEMYADYAEIEPFSLSDVDMTTARLFIDYLVGLCLQHGVPTRKPLYNMTDDIGSYLYMCLEHKKCAVCGRAAEVHHVDRIGMGNNRDEICHVGMLAVALCREHHEKAHINEAALFEDNHIYGIKLDGYLVNKLGLGVATGGSSDEGRG